MSWPGYDRHHAAAIAVGGVLGASVRHAVARRDAIDGVLVWDPPELADAEILVPGATDGNLLILMYGFPYGTILVNVAGCLILGLLTVVARRQMSQSTRRWVVGASIGFCGSLTTFSSFAVEAAQLLRGRPNLADRYPEQMTYFDPAVADAVGYLSLSLIGGAIAFWVGRRLAKRMSIATGDSA